MAEVEIGVPDGITREDVERAAEVLRKEGLPEGYGASKLYEVLVGGDRFPLKAIIGLAAKRVAGRVLSNREFNGGKRDKSFKVLEELGFEIVPKEPSVASPSPVSAVGAAIEELIPDAETRYGLLEALSQAIIAAHEANPASWALTLPKPGGIFNLNVGKIFVVRVHADRTELAVSRAHIDGQEAFNSGWRTAELGDGFKSFEDITWYAVPTAEVGARWPEAAGAVLEASRVAAQKWSRTNHYLKHRNDAVEYIESELDIELPRPEYGEEDLSKLYTSLAESFLELRETDDQDGEKVRGHVQEHRQRHENWQKILQSETADQEAMLAVLVDTDWRYGSNKTVAPGSVDTQEKADHLLAQLKKIAANPPTNPEELEQTITSLPRGFSLGFVSEFLVYALPDRYWELNSPVREAVKLIGFDAWDELPRGAKNDYHRYFAMRPMVEGIRAALETAGLDGASFLDVDLLLYEVARKPENFPIRPEKNEFDYLVENLKTYHPGFTTFDDQQGSWWKNETSYKLELIRLFNEKLPQDLFDQEENEEWGKEVVNRTWGVFTDKLSAEGPQNLLSFRYYQFLLPLRSGGENSLAFARALRDLLFGDPDPPARIEEFNSRLFPLIEKKYEASPPAMSRSFPTIFLMLHDPANNIFVRTNEFNDVHRCLTGEPLFEQKMMDAEEYSKSLQFAGELFTRLKSRGFKPRDLMDVQGFLHVVANRNAWIFQAVGKVWDLERFLKDGHRQVAWSLPQNAGKVSEGDAAYLWVAGENRGVVAYGTVISDALSRKLIPDEIWEVDQEYYNDKSAGPNAQQFALIEIDRVFPDNRVTAERLKTHKKLKALSILKQAAGTVFSVPKPLAVELYQLLPKERTVPTFDDILASLRKKGLYFPDELVANYLLALQTKRFVILTGISGTGKTQLAMAVAEACPAWQEENVAGEDDGDALRIVVKPYMKKYRRFVVPARLVELTNWELSEDATSMGRVKVAFGDRVVEQSFYRSPTRKVTILLLSGELREWFDSEFSEGDEFLLELLPQDELAGGDLKISKPQTSTKRTRTKNSIVVAVRPDWTDHRGLLGYFNPLTGRYVQTPFLEMVMAASRDDKLARAQDREPSPFFVVLDEMNLARVEHYFSDLLSCMESGQPIHLHDDEAVAAGETEDGVAIPRELEIPPNFFVIGTVNVDETTYMFSPKVLDRAFTIELNFVSLSAHGDPSGKDETGRDRRSDTALRLTKFKGLQGRWEKPNTVHFSEMGDLTGHSWGHLNDRLVDLNTTLENEGRHFGYRVANEIARFVMLAVEQSEGDGETVEAAFDLAVLEKVLPKFNGTQQELQSIINELFSFAMNPDKTWDGPGPSDLEVDWKFGHFFERADGKPNEAKLSDEGDKIKGRAFDAALPRTARKLWRMARRMKQRGYVSYIE